MSDELLADSAAFSKAMRAHIIERLKLAFDDIEVESSPQRNTPSDVTPPSHSDAQRS